MNPACIFYSSVVGVDACTSMYLLTYICVDFFPRRKHIHSCFLAHSRQLWWIRAFHYCCVRGAGTASCQQRCGLQSSVSWRTDFALNMVGWDSKRGKAFGSPDIQNNIIWKIVSKIINLLLHPVLLNIPAGRISTKRPWRMSSTWKKDGMTLPKHRLYQRRKSPKD